MDRLKLRLHGIFYPPGTTPMKWKLHSIVFLSLFCSATSITILFPFLPAMVKSFGKTDEETGYYAGLIASAMFVGRSVSSYFWGWLTDRVGRRPVMIINLVCLTACMAAFGLSVSLKMAIITRLFVGLGHGIVGTCKAMISEICDDTNQSLGMSVLMSAWNFGLIIGPAMGGFLAEPSQKHPNVFPKGSFFDKFPFFLPCLLNCVMILFTLLLVYFFLPETLVKREASVEGDDPSETIEATSGSLDNQCESNEQKLLSQSEKSCSAIEHSQEKKEMEILICDDSSELKERSRSCCPCRNQPNRASRCCLCFRNSTIGTLLRNRAAMLSIAAYCFFSFVIIGFEELFTLWAATEPIHGGLGFSTDQIGTALLSVVVPLLFLQMWVFPKLERRIGALRVFQLVCVVIGILCSVLPTINTFYNRSTVLWPLLIGILLPIKLCVGCGFGSTALFINNSVSPHLLGTVNGLAMTLTSFTRALAPIVGGSVFAWSISQGYKFGFPLDEHLTFIVFTVVCLLTLLFSCILPKGLNKRQLIEETSV